jgi:hypothetical protein
MMIGWGAIGEFVNAKPIKIPFCMFYVVSSYFEMTLHGGNIGETFISGTLLF